MRRVIVFAALAAGMASGAAAQGSDTEDAERNWTISATGGISLTGDGGEDQAFGGVSVTRELDESWVQLSFDAVDAGNTFGFLNVVPASTRTLTLSAGTSFGEVGIDTQISKGWRDFDNEAINLRNSQILIEGDGDSFGFGASLTYDAVIGERDFLSPYISGSYDRLDVQRVIIRPNGDPLSVEETEDGFTGTLGLSWQRLFGSEFQHNAGLFVAGVASSNTAAAVTRDTPLAFTQLVASRDGIGQSDTWLEVGGSASLGLSPAVRFNLSGVRTLGFAGPEATSLAAGLSFSF